MRYKPRTLRDFIENEQVDDDQLKSILYSLLCSLQYLHQSNIVHRDLKPEHILIDDKGVVITDFAHARTLPESAQSERQGNSIKVRNSVIKLSKAEPKGTFTQEELSSKIGSRLSAIQSAKGF